MLTGSRVPRERGYWGRKARARDSGSGPVSDAVSTHDALMREMHHPGMKYSAEKGEIWLAMVMGLSSGFR